MYLFAMASFSSLLPGWCYLSISALAWQENMLRGHNTVKLPLPYVIDHEEVILNSERLGIFPDCATSSLQLVPGQPSYVCGWWFISPADVLKVCHV